MQLLLSFGQKQKYLRYIFNYFCRRSRISVSKNYPRIDINWQPNWPELSLQQIPSPLEEVDSSGSCLSCFLILYILSIWIKNISFSFLFPAKAQKRCSKPKRRYSFIWKPSIPSYLPRAPPSQSRSFLLTPNSSIPTRHATSFAKPSPSPLPSITAGHARSRALKPWNFEIIVRALRRDKKQAP